MLTNVLLPLQNRDLVISFPDMPVTMQLVRDYLQFNDTKCDTLPDGADPLTSPITWTLTQYTDADGNIVAAPDDPSLFTIHSYLLSLAPWSDTASELTFAVPTDLRISQIAYTQPVTEVIPVKWCVDMGTGKKFWAYSTFKAVIDENGNTLYSYLNAWEGRVADGIEQVDKMRRKLLKTVTAYQNLTTDATATPVPDASPSGVTAGYYPTAETQLYIDDTLTLPLYSIQLTNPDGSPMTDPDTGAPVTEAIQYQLVDADTGEILTTPQLSIKYVANTDRNIAIYTSKPITDVTATLNQLASRTSAAYGNVSIAELASGNITLTDHDNGEVYEVITAVNIPDVSLMRADVDDAMAAVATMQTEVAAATAAATAADAAATAATTAATDATTAANAATTAVTTLQADVTANTAAIATNTASIAQNTTDIATNVTTIATNATDIATNTAAIAQNTTDIATNATNIATNTAAIAQHTTDIATNATNIATNTTAIANAEASITTLQTDLAAHVALYTTLKADHDALQTAHDTLQAAHDAHILLYNALKADHDALQTAYTAHEALYTTLKADHDALQTAHDNLLADLTAHKALYDTLKAKVDEMEEKMITGTATGGTPLPTLP